MEKNYYENVIKKVKNLLKTKEYTAAIDVLLEELNQVYIPLSYENEFHDLYNEAQSYILDEDEPLPKMTSKQLIKLLNGSYEQQFAAINKLDDLNLRNYLDVIQEYFLSDNLQQLKGRLLDLCAAQELNYDFEFKISNETITVNPSKLETVDEMEFINLAFDYFNDHLYKNPSFIQIAQITLVEKIYSIYPKVFLVDNLEVICKSIIDEIDQTIDVELISSLSSFYH